MHDNSKSYVTIGSARAQWVSSWTGLDLDYYQTHYYDWIQSSPSDDLFQTSSGQLGLDRPLVVGEFPAANSKTAGLEQYLDMWYDNGFAGAWPWSYNKVDGQGATGRATFSSWSTDHSESVGIPTANEGARMSGEDFTGALAGRMPTGAGVIAERQSSGSAR